MDRLHRLIYVDHLHKRTSWHPPVVLQRDADTLRSRRRTVLGAGEQPLALAAGFLKRADFIHQLYRNQASRDRAKCCSNFSRCTVLVLGFVYGATLMVQNQFQKIAQCQ